MPPPKGKTTLKRDLNVIGAGQALHSICHPLYTLKQSPLYPTDGQGETLFLRLHLLCLLPFLSRRPRGDGIACDATPTFCQGQANGGHGVSLSASTWGWPQATGGLYFGPAIVMASLPCYASLRHLTGAAQPPGVWGGVDLFLLYFFFENYFIYGTKE